jgi:acyl carrier protein
MTELEIKRKLLEFICRNFMVEENEVEMDRSLVDQGIIDSFGLIEMSAFLTRTFGITVVETDMNRANFGSVDKITNFVKGKGAK